MKKLVIRLPRNILATGITSFFTDTSTKMVYSIMPLFLLSLGASKTTISLIEGVAESTASLLKAISGYWSDKIGRNKPFMLLGYGVTALVTPLYAFIWLPMQVLVVRFVERVGKGVRTAPRDSLISASIPKGETGRSFGFQKAMDNSGAIIGPLLASLFLFFSPKNYSALFLLATIPAIFGYWLSCSASRRKNRLTINLAVINLYADCPSDSICFCWSCSCFLWETHQMLYC